MWMPWTPASTQENLQEFSGCLVQIKTNMNQKMSDSVIFDTGLAFWFVAIAEFFSEQHQKHCIVMQAVWPSSQQYAVKTDQCSSEAFANHSSTTKSSPTSTPSVCWPQLPLTLCRHHPQENRRPGLAQSGHLPMPSSALGEGFVYFVKLGEVSTLADWDQVYQKLSETAYFELAYRWG